MIVGDVQLKSIEPIRWLDLALCASPNISSGQELVIESIRNRHFTVDHYAQRLNTMRRLGGEFLSDWLAHLRRAFAPVSRASFDDITNEAFTRPELPPRLPKIIEAPALQLHMKRMKAKQEVAA
jgi:hypothetical protein